MTDKYQYTACLKRGDNSGITKNKRNDFNEALEDLIELNNINKTLGDNISFIGVVKHKANENPLDKIRNLNINEYPLDIYTRIVNTMDELRKKDGKSICAKENDRGISKDYMLCKRVRYNCNIAFDVEAYYDEDTFALIEFQIYLKRKGKYDDCCTLPSYFEEQQEKDLREFVNMYVD